MLSKILKPLQDLSLDIVLGAITMSWLFAKSNNVHSSHATYAILGIAVWLIYTFDHLRDAKKIKTRAQTSRHRFHQDHFNALCAIWGALLLTDFLLSLIYLPLKTWLLGSAVAAFTIVHFVLIHLFGSHRSKLVLKEVGGAWCFATGVTVGPLSHLDKLSWPPISSFILLFLIALFNLIMFGFFEFKNDVRQGHASIAINYGKNQTRLILNAIFFTTVTLGLYMLTRETGNLYFYLLNGYLLFIAIGYYLMIQSPIYMNRTGLYRILGDGVFVAPSILIAFGQL